MCEPTRDPPRPWPSQLWAGGHCWHFAGADNCQVILACCSCAYTMIVTDSDHSWLRFSLMVGGERIAMGRGYLVGDCEAGSRRLTPDGYGHVSCTHAYGDWSMTSDGLVSFPTKEGDAPC